MNQFILSILIITISISCSSSLKNKSQELPTNNEVPTTQILIKDKVSLKASELSGFSSTGVDQLREAIELCELKINEENYKTKYLQLNFNTKDNLSKSNEQIYKEFITGKDIYEKDIDNTINLHLKAYRPINPYTSALGYTTKDSRYIFINTRKLSRHSACGLCGLFVHEYHHNLGYYHPVNARWDSSVPYAVGDMTVDYCLGK